MGHNRNITIALQFLGDTSKKEMVLWVDMWRYMRINCGHHKLHALSPVAQVPAAAADGTVLCSKRLESALGSSLSRFVERRVLHISDLNKN